MHTSGANCTNNLVGENMKAPAGLGKIAPVVVAKLHSHKVQLNSTGSFESNILLHACGSIRLLLLDLGQQSCLPSRATSREEN